MVGKTISDLVSEYMALSGRNDMSFKAQILIRAKYVWKDIRNNVLKVNSRKWVLVDKTESLFKAKLPCNLDMFINVGIIDDCGNYKPLNQYNDMPITKFEKLEDKCNCNDELKQCIVTTETKEERVAIYSTQYYKYTTTIVSSNGDVYVKVIEPIPNYDSQGTFINVTPDVVSEKLICKLKTKECGCIEVSQENLNKICDNFCKETAVKCNEICNKKFNQPDSNLIVESNNGYYKLDVGFVYLYGNIPAQVLINYKTNGEAEEEELIPDFASIAFFKGLDYWNNLYATTVDRFQKKQSKIDFDTAKEELESSLPRNKMFTHEFNNLTNAISKW